MPMIHAPLFDDPDFNARLFFPRPDTSPCPPTARDVEVPVTDASLHLRVHRAPDTRGALLLFHGNGEVVADYDDVAPRFASVGLDLAVVDFRGYGESTGAPTIGALVDDALPALRAFLAQVGDRPAFVMGRSLGSACAAEVYGSAEASRLRGAIFESGFTDLDALVRRRDYRPEAPVVDARFDPLPKLARGTIPLLVLHGELDRIIALREGEAAFAAAGTDRKRLVTIPGRGHNDLSFSEAYWSAIATLVASTC